MSGMTEFEQARLAKLEGIIASGLPELELTADEARVLTDQVKEDAERLWLKLLRLYAGGAHIALGYSSWGDYFETEFRGSRRRGYELLQAGRVFESVRHGALPPPANERQARELAPLLDEPEQLRDAWQEASANGKPTAAVVREAVERRLPPVSPEAREKQLRWAATRNVLDVLDLFDRDPAEDQAEREARLIDQQAAAQYGQQVTPQRLRRAAAWAALLADALERTTA